MLSRTQFAELIDAENSSLVRDLFLSVPFSTHLTGVDEELDSDYYLRHRVETVKRIRLTAKTDALSLAQMIDLDYEAARPWSRYIAEELDHDLLYLADLRQHGYTNEQVADIEPFPSTQRMLAYLHEQLREVGPLAAVAYSVFVEWNSERGSQRVVEKAERQFSSRHVAGSRQHVGIDDEEDHYQVMVDVAYRLVSRLGDEQVLVRLLRDIAGFFGEYFLELYEATVGAREPAAVGV
jgi:hypothetical protein